MTGDIDDCHGRLLVALPSGWMAGPVVSALLYGVATVLAFCFALLGAVRAQARITTASGDQLDLVAADFFGNALLRSAGEPDASLRARIKAGLFRERGTRKAAVQVLEQLTGYKPLIAEPFQATDCGAYGQALSGYGSAGCYGSQQCPASAFITAFHAPGPWAGNLPGYGNANTGYGAPRGAYLPAASLEDAGNQPIYAALEAARPEGVVWWVRVRAAV